MNTLFNDVDYLISFTGKLQILAFWHTTSEIFKELITEDVEEAKAFIMDNYNMDDIDLTITDW